MRVAMAGFLHETNTFAPEPADMAAFKVGGGYVPMVTGPAMIDAFQEVNLGMTGALKVAGDSGWDVVPVLWAGAIPSAPVTQEAFDSILAEILDSLRAAGPLDGVFLDLHGAMVATHHDDGEGEIARQVRALVGPDVPIAAALDLHGNISEDFVNTVDVLAGFRTYPHIDMADTGAVAARLLDHVMKTGTRPAKAFRRMSYLVPIPFQTTDMQPAKGLYENLREVEAQGALSASLFMGFPAADIADCGPTAVAYAETQAAADAAADAVADAYAAAESEFDNDTFTPDAAVAYAARAAKGAGQGPAQDATIGLIVDPHSAAQAHELGEGAHAVFRIGGHPGLPDDSPVEVEAVVEMLSDGKVKATGPYYGGTMLNLGPSACLRIGGVRVAVSTRIAQMADREMFRFVGIAPETQKIVVVKSSTHFRADFTPSAREIIVARAPGPMPFDPADLPFTRLRDGLRLSPNGPVFGAARAAAARPDTGGSTGGVQI